MTLVRIDDPADSLIAAYRDIRERDLVGRHGRFIAEGKVVLEHLFFAGRFTAESALILDTRLPGMADTLAKAPPDMPVYVASRAVIDQIAGFPMHRGVLAIGRRDEAETVETCWRPCRRTRSCWRSSASPTMTIWARSSAMPPPSARPQS